jgi:phosphatidylserine decarboxylase
LRKGFIAREGLIFILPSLMLAVLLFVLQARILAAVASLFFLFFLFFFRNPNRQCPHDRDRLISPADGHVMEIKEIDEKEFLNEKRKRIAIFMSPLDVHVNRAPCEGRVTAVSHRRGEFAMAFKKEIDKANERNYIVISTGSFKIMMVQIAGFLARRIISYVHEGDNVSQGSAVGMIAFGSRVDVYLPKDFEPVVQLREKVKAGLTVLAEKRG